MLLASLAQRLSAAAALNPGGQVFRGRVYRLRLFYLRGRLEWRLGGPACESESR